MSVALRSRPVDAHLASLDRDGFVVLENAVPKALIDRVRREAEAWFDRTPRCRGHFYGFDTTRFGRTLTKCPSSRDLVLHPAILAIMDAMLAPHCDWYQLNLTQAVRIHPGAREQPVHRDDEMWPIMPKPHEFSVNVMWAVDDFTEDNGATRLWPGSHRGEISRTPAVEDSVVAAMPRGSALVFLGSVLHCGGANRAPRARTGLIVSYSLGWLKAYENPYLSYPPEVARTLPRALRDLVGYRIHRPNLGGYENGSPAILLDSDRPPEGLAAVDCLPPEIEAMLEEMYADVR